MLLLVFRQLQLEPPRTFLTAFALASVVAVILIFEGFLEGIVAQSENAVMSRGADLIVSQAGVKNMTLARSVLPQLARGEVEAVDGVAAAHPLTGIAIIYEQDGRRAPLLLIVFDTRGGPARLDSGAPPNAPREIVVDESFAERFEVGIGDAVSVSDFDFRISGIAEGAAAFFSAFGFVRFDDLIDFYFESDLASDIGTFPLLSFLLVELTPAADRDVVSADIERTVPSVDVFTPAELASRDAALGRALIGPIIGLLVAAGYVSGALVSGIIVFAAVNARRRDFGVLKALGFTPRFLAASVVVEALVLALIALPVGLVLARVTAWGIETAMPLYLVPVAEPEPLLRTAVACVAFAVLGALTPVGRIRRLDPSLVFRS